MSHPKGWANGRTFGDERKGARAVEDLSQVKRGELQQEEAAALCRLDYRHLRRLYQRYCQQGDRGLEHQGRGRPSNRARSAEFKAAVLARYQERYPDFGPTLAAEKLTLDGLVVNHETLHHWLIKPTVCATSKSCVAQFSIWQRTALGLLSPRLSVNQKLNSEGVSK